MIEKAKRFCKLTGLSFLNVSGDGWLDTREQRNLSPVVWLVCLAALERLDPE